MLVTDEQILEALRTHEGEHMPVRRLSEILGYYGHSAVHSRLKDLESRNLIEIKYIRKTEITVKGV